MKQFSLCSLLLVLGSFAAVNAAEKADSFDWNLTNGCLTITGKNAAGSIPDYTYIGQAPWSNDSSSIRTIVCNNIQYVGNRAFSGLDYLRSIRFDGSLNNMGLNVFENDRHLRLLFFQSTVPPTIDQFTFNLNIESKLDALYLVPDAVKNDYQIASNWAGRRICASDTVYSKDTLDGGGSIVNGLPGLRCYVQEADSLGSLRLRVEGQSGNDSLYLTQFNSHAWATPWYEYGEFVSDLEVGKGIFYLGDGNFVSLTRLQTITFTEGAHLFDKPIDPTDCTPFFEAFSDSITPWKISFEFSDNILPPKIGAVDLLTFQPRYANTMLYVPDAFVPDTTPGIKSIDLYKSMKRSNHPNDWTIWPEVINPDHISAHAVNVRNVTDTTANLWWHPIEHADSYTLTIYRGTDSLTSITIYTNDAYGSIDPAVYHYVPGRRAPMDDDGGMTIVISLDIDEANNAASEINANISGATAATEYSYKMTSTSFADKLANMKKTGSFTTVDPTSIVSALPSVINQPEGEKWFYTLNGARVYDINTAPEGMYIMVENGEGKTVYLMH